MQIQLRSMKYYDGHTIVVKLTGNEFAYIHTVSGYKFPGFRLAPYSHQHWQVIPVGSETVDVRHVMHTLYQHFASQVEFFGKAYLMDEKKKLGQSDDYLGKMYQWHNKQWDYKHIKNKITRGDARKASEGLVKRVRNIKKDAGGGGSQHGLVSQFTVHDGGKTNAA